MERGRQTSGGPPNPAQETAMSITGKARDNIRLRAAASFDSPEIGFINVTKDVEILGVEGDWLRVRWNNKEGYVARKFILVKDVDADQLAQMANYPEPPSQSAEKEPKPAGEAKPAAKPKRTKVNLSAKKPINDEE